MNKKVSSESVVKDIRRRTRRKYSSEEKIRIVLEGLRGKERIANPCRQRLTQRVLRLNPPLGLSIMLVVARQRVKVGGKPRWFRVNIASRHRSLEIFQFLVKSLPLLIHPILAYNRKNQDVRY